MAHDFLYSAEVEGVDELVKRFAAAGNYTHVRRFALKVIVAGAKPLRAAIRTEAPVGPPSDKKRGNLRASVGYKASRKATGNIAYMIGPFGKGSQHRHLVIYGHEIVGHKPNLTRTGVHTKPNNFVQRGENKARQASFDAIAVAATSALDELTKP